MNKDKLKEARKLLRGIPTIHDVDNACKLIDEALEEPKSYADIIRPGDWVEVSNQKDKWFLARIDIHYRNGSIKARYSTNRGMDESFFDCSEVRPPQLPGILIRHDGGPKPEWIKDEFEVMARESGYAHNAYAKAINWAEVDLYMVWPESGKETDRG